ncbi:IclR family transcriptional regulator [Pandoraea communis]|uniref:IclR family transcriptional regulator n=1 Tax=Pandoraea communis TaxID=2508297 RepID=A0A5E4V2S4_9BURK|nr:IclR family transcriptional regulator [Pandoraea communis]MDM8356149.1 IclR family transcriptional regulator [Pandoraea communis]VVE06518.1 IclR family transcriptional regulator [Pandoraea communis]
MNSLLKSIEIIEAVSEHQPVGVGELSKLLEMPKSSVQRVLLTFQEAGWLRQAGGETTRWEIGPRVLAVRPNALKGGALQRAAREPMQELCKLVDETVHLSVPDGTDAMVLVEESECKQFVRTAYSVGDVSPFHATANGLALLAFMNEKQIATILARDLPKYGDRTINDPALIRAELERIRARGYSINLGQYRRAIYAIGAPIFDNNGVAVASVCISMPEQRFTESRIDEWARAVMEAAARISTGGVQG